MLAYLSDFGPEAFARITRDSDGFAVTVTWDAEELPVCWLWEELQGTQGAPWYGQVRVVALEPGTSWPGQGISAAADKTGTQVVLEPHSSRRFAVTLDITPPQASEEIKEPNS
jgi:hypothetical protein